MRVQDDELTRVAPNLCSSMAIEAHKGEALQKQCQAGSIFEACLHDEAPSTVQKHLSRFDFDAECQHCAAGQTENLCGGGGVVVVVVVVVVSSR